MRVCVMSYKFNILDNVLPFFNRSVANTSFENYFTFLNLLLGEISNPLFLAGVRQGQGGLVLL